MRPKGSLHLVSLVYLIHRWCCTRLEAYIDDMMIITHTNAFVGCDFPSFSTFSSKSNNSSGMSHFDSFVSVYVDET